LKNSDARARMAAAGGDLVDRKYDLPAIARGVRKLYDQLIEAKSCTT